MIDSVRRQVDLCSQNLLKFTLLHAERADLSSSIYQYNLEGFAVL